MVIHKYEGSVYLTERQLRGKIRMYGTTGKEYCYRSTIVSPILKHIKRIHA